MSKPSLKKSKTFFSMKSPSPVSKSASFHSGKASSNEFALMSPNLKKETEIVHFSHPQHPLAPVHLPYLFMCMGCKEYGAGKRFRCQICDFDLHDFCALAHPSLQSHPLHSKHQLIFFHKPGGFLLSKCDVCGKATKGFAYRCTTCNFEMHPSCAQFQKQMEFPTHGHPLSLSMGSAHSVGDSSIVCGECGAKRVGLMMYNCSVCDYHLHALCAKDMVNGLYVHGIKAPKKQSRIGAAAKLASHVFLGFLGGLIEGIGEGVGEVFIESLAKGNGTRDKKIAKS